MTCEGPGVRIPPSPLYAKQRRRRTKVRRFCVYGCERQELAIVSEYLYTQKHEVRPLFVSHCHMMKKCGTVGQTPVSALKVGLFFATKSISCAGVFSCKVILANTTMVWKCLGWGEAFTRALCRGCVNKDMPWRALYWGGLFASFVLLISNAAFAHCGHR